MIRARHSQTLAEDGNPLIRPTVRAWINVSGTTDDD